MLSDYQIHEPYYLTIIYGINLLQRISKLCTKYNSREREMEQKNLIQLLAITNLTKCLTNLCVPNYVSRDADLCPTHASPIILCIKRKVLIPLCNRTCDLVLRFAGSLTWEILSSWSPVVHVYHCLKVSWMYHKARQQHLTTHTRLALS